MPINRLYLLLFISISYYLARFYLCGSDLDIYSTNVYYFNWLESLGSVQLSGRLFFDVVQATAGEIRSFEPVAGFIFLGLVNVFEKPSDVIVLSNMIFLVVYFFTLSNSNQGALFSLLGVVAVIFGYYEFAVMELTHRLKVSVLFLFLFSYFYAHNRRRLAIVNLGLSVFSHFSMVIVLPYIYLLSRQGLIRPIARTSYLSFFVLILVMFGGLSTVLSDSVISQVFANKVHYFAIFFDVIGYKSILLGGGIVWALFRLLRGSGSDYLVSIIFVVVFIASIVVMGTGRMLMQYYFIFMATLPFIFYDRSYFSRILYLFWGVLFLYSCYSGLTKGGAFLFVDKLTGG